MLVPTPEARLDLAATRDLATRKIVGWSMPDHVRTKWRLAAHNRTSIDIRHHRVRRPFDGKALRLAIKFTKTRM